MSPPGLGPPFGSSQIYFSHSTNGGGAFSKGIAISPARPGQGCDIAVEADGDVYVLWRDFELSGSKKNFGISAVRSPDGGQTFSKPVKIAALPQYTPFDTARDCGDGTEACPSGFVFSRVPLEPRITSDPTGELPGIYAVVQQGDPSTKTDSATSYHTTGVPGRVSRGIVTVYRSVDDGRTWAGPFKVTAAPTGHQFFPDADALDGRLAVVWQDSREDPSYSVQLPVGNTTAATSSGDAVVNTDVAVSTDGTTFGGEQLVSSVGNQPQYEMFAAASIPFYGDYNWIQLMERGDGSLFGYMTWTDNRDVVEGTDPRETTQDGFDVESGWVLQPGGRHLHAPVQPGRVRPEHLRELDRPPVTGHQSGASPESGIEARSTATRSPGRLKSSVTTTCRPNCVTRRKHVPSPHLGSWRHGAWRASAARGNQPATQHGRLAPLVQRVAGRSPCRGPGLDALDASTRVDRSDRGRPRPRYAGAPSGADARRRAP